MFWLAMGMVVLAIVLRFFEARSYARENRARVARWNEFQARMGKQHDA